MDSGTTWVRSAQQVSLRRSSRASAYGFGGRGSLIRRTNSACQVRCLSIVFQLFVCLVSLSLLSVGPHAGAAPTSRHNLCSNVNTWLYPRKLLGARVQGRHRLRSWATAGSVEAVEQSQRHAGTAYAGFNVTKLGGEDLACLSTRQLYFPVEKVDNYVVGCGRRCRHGWPQAIVCDPLNHTYTGVMAFLSCPLLTTAIETLEGEGAVDEYNARIAEDPAWRHQLAEANEAHHTARHEVLCSRRSELDALREKLGDKAIDSIMARGLDLAVGTEKIRCLHMQVADELVRGNNIIGQQVLTDLETRGTQTLGNDVCHQHCSMRTPLEQLDWNFKSHKKSVRAVRKRQVRLEGSAVQTLNHRSIRIQHWHLGPVLRWRDQLTLRRASFYERHCEQWKVPKRPHPTGMHPASSLQALDLLPDGLTVARHDHVWNFSRRSWPTHATSTRVISRVKAATQLRQAARRDAMRCCHRNVPCAERNA